MNFKILTCILLFGFGASAETTPLNTLMKDVKKIEISPVEINGQPIKEEAALSVCQLLGYDMVMDFKSETAAQGLRYYVSHLSDASVKDRHVLRPLEKFEYGQSRLTSLTCGQSRK